MKMPPLYEGGSLRWPVVLSFATSMFLNSGKSILEFSIYHLSIAIRGLTKAFTYSMKS